MAETGGTAPRSFWSQVNRVHAHIRKFFTLQSLTLAAALSGCLSGPATQEARLRALGQAAAAPWADPEEVLVTINGRPITRGDFYRRVLDRLGTLEIFRGVIKDELFRQEAERLGITVTDAEVAREADKVLESWKDDEEGFKAVLADYGGSLEVLRSELERKLRAELLVVKVTQAMRRIDDEVLRDYHRRTTGTKRWVVRHIAFRYLPPPGREDLAPAVLKKEAYLRALKAVERLRAGADFAALAREESDDLVTRRRGGELGPVSEYSPLPEELKRAIFALRPGEISDPVENPLGGYHVFQVTDIFEPEPFEKVKERLRRELEEMPPTPAEIQRALDALRARARIRIEAEPVESQRAGEASGGEEQ